MLVRRLRALLIVGIAVARPVAADVPVFTAQPTPVSTLPAPEVVFTAEASGAQFYQWQQSKGSGPWTDLQETVRFGGVTTTTLMIRDVAADLHGTAYHLVATNEDGSATSFNAGLIVNALPLTVLYSFTGGADGGNPRAPLLEASDGYLYGLTGPSPGANTATLFRMSHAGELTTLHSYGNSNLEPPTGGVVEGADGSFYWTAPFAGYGAVFKMTAEGTASVLHSFSAGGGIYPNGVIQGRDGRLYGTTRAGGGLGEESIGAGTVFSLTTSGEDFQMLYAFPGGSSSCNSNRPDCGRPPWGNHPYSALLQTGDGYFYGTTYSGGIGSTIFGGRNRGTVFEMSPSGEVRYLHWFVDLPDNDPDSEPHRGQHPRAPLIQAPGGDFFGTTSEGSPCADFGSISIFQMSPVGAVTGFCNPGGGGYGGSDSGLLLASDGNFYGVGGGEGCGSILMMTAAGQVTTLYTSDCQTVGAFTAALVEGRDGMLYGTATGGVHGWGVVFRIAPPTLVQRAPTMSSQPTRLTILSPGGRASLFVAATGTPPLAYQWYRGTRGDTSNPVAGASTRFLTTPSIGAPSRYWARIINGQGSADSNTATVTVTFTDDPVVPRASVIRGVHVSELRSRIDAVRVRNGLASYAYSGSIASGALVRAAHVAELRTALQQAYAQAGLAAPSYTNAIAAGAPIMGLDLAEIRSAVQGIE